MSRYSACPAVASTLLECLEAVLIRISAPFSELLYRSCLQSASTPLFISSSVNSWCLPSSRSGSWIWSTTHRLTKASGRVRSSLVVIMMSGAGCDISTLLSRPSGAKLPEPRASSRPFGTSLSALSISSIKTTQPLPALARDSLLPRPHQIGARILFSRQ